MFERNSGMGESNITQNRFTAYLLVAIRNTRKMYLDKMGKIRAHEQSLETSICDGNLLYEPDMLGTLQLPDQFENAALQDAFNQLSGRDRHIFIRKAIEGKPLRDIGAELGLGFNTVSTAYHRMIRRLRKELMSNGVEFQDAADKGKRKQ